MLTLQDFWFSPECVSGVGCSPEGAPRQRDGMLAVGSCPREHCGGNAWGTVGGQAPARSAPTALGKALFLPEFYFLWSCEKREFEECLLKMWTRTAARMGDDFGATWTQLQVTLNPDLFSPSRNMNEKVYCVLLCPKYLSGNLLFFIKKEANPDRKPSF